MTEMMKAIELTSYDGVSGLRLVEKPVPTPGRDEVLVKVATASINPSDLMFIIGRYGFTKELPVVGGFEGSGTVIATGDTLMARYMKGRRVAFAVQESGDGTWAEYAVTKPTLCVPLIKGVTLEQGASLLVNPLTAWALIDIAKKGKHKAFVQNASAGALGRMITRLGDKMGLTSINIVRRQGQVDLLKSEGVKHVLNSSDPDFDQQLKSLAKALNARIAFDPVAGEMTGRVLHNLPTYSTIHVYGALSESASIVDPGQLIFGDKQIKGFWLATWLSRQGLINQLRTSTKVQRVLGSELKTTVQARYSLEDGIKGIEQYANNMTDGKVLLTNTV